MGIRGKRRKIRRNVLGRKKNGNKLRERSEKELYMQNEKLSDSIRKRRITFYRYLVRMQSDLLTKRIFVHFDKTPKTKVKHKFAEVKMKLCLNKKIFHL